MVRKDLVDSGQVKTLRDLKGRKIAQTAKGIILDYTLGVVFDFGAYFPNLAACEPQGVFLTGRGKWGDQ